MLYFRSGHKRASKLGVGIYGLVVGGGGGGGVVAAFPLCLECLDTFIGYAFLLKILGILDATEPGGKV